MRPQAEREKRGLLSFAISVLGGLSDIIAPQSCEGGQGSSEDDAVLSLAYGYTGQDCYCDDGEKLR